MEYDLCDAKPLCQQNKLEVVAANNPRVQIREQLFRKCYLDCFHNRLYNFIIRCEIKLLLIEYAAFHHFSFCYFVKACMFV